MTTHDNKRLTVNCCPEMAYLPNSFKDNALQMSPWRVPPSPLLPDKDLRQSDVSPFFVQSAHGPTNAQ